MYYPKQAAGKNGNDRTDNIYIYVLSVSVYIRNGLRLGRSEVLWNLRHYLRAQGQGHHTEETLVDLP